MDAKQSWPRILFPRSINEALEMSGNENQSVFWAGGTRLSSSGDRSAARIKLPKVVIALSMVEEMARASRSENGLEIGAMLSLDRLASISRLAAITPGLSRLLRSIGTRPLRCRATVGGNLAYQERRGDLLPLLQLLDTKVEIRYLRERRSRRKPVATVRRIPLALLEGEDGLRRGDLITKISIPAGKWNFAMIEKLPSITGPGGRELIFQAIARLDKGTLADWRMAIWDGRDAVIRNRDLEVALAGSPLPLTSRNLEDLEEGIVKATKGWSDRKEDRNTAICLARTFMKRAAG